MVRELDEKDIEILKKLAPEIKDLICQGSGVEFHSILPPVSRHFARDEQDFKERISRLTPDELAYLVHAIEDGSESLGCMPPEDLEELLKLVDERVSPDAAKKVLAVYESGGECER